MPAGVGQVALLFIVGLLAPDAEVGFQPCRRRLPGVRRRLTRIPYAHHTKTNAPGSVEPAWPAAERRRRTFPECRRRLVDVAITVLS